MLIIELKLCAQCDLISLDVGGLFILNTSQSDSFPKLLFDSLSYFARFFAIASCLMFNRHPAAASCKPASSDPIISSNSRKGKKRRCWLTNYQSLIVCCLWTDLSIDWLIDWLKCPCDQKNHFLFFLRFWKCVCLTLDWQNSDLSFLSKGRLLWV